MFIFYELLKWVFYCFKNVQYNGIKCFILNNFIIFFCLYNIVFDGFLYYIVIYIFVMFMRGGL